MANEYFSARFFLFRLERNVCVCALIPSGCVLKSTGLVLDSFQSLLYEGNKQTKPTRSSRCPLRLQTIHRHFAQLTLISAAMLPSKAHTSLQMHTERGKHQVPANLTLLLFLLSLSRLPGLELKMPAPPLRIPDPFPSRLFRTLSTALLCGTSFASVRTAVE